MRTSLWAWTIAATLIYVSQTASAEENDCGTNTGSTYYEACTSAKFRPTLEKELRQKYEAALQSLSSPEQTKMWDLLVAAQQTWVSFRDATCKLENEHGGINSIGWARCYDDMLSERIKYFDEHVFF